MSRGFTLFDIAFVLLLLTVLGMVAIPGALDRVRIADEARAISALQWIAAAQARLRDAPAGTAIDRDRDGQAEYAFLPDLVRATPTNGAWGPSPVPKDTDKDIFRLPGFYLAVLLAGPSGEPLLPSQAARVEADFAERTFAAVAWPIEAGRTGYRAYYVDHGLLAYEHPNADDEISGRYVPALPAAVMASRNPRNGAVLPPSAPSPPWVLFLKREQARLLEKRLGPPEEK